jgi:hypothetical protein
MIEVVLYASTVAQKRIALLSVLRKTRNICSQNPRHSMKKYSTESDHPAQLITSVKALPIRAIEHTIQIRSIRYTGKSTIEEISFNVDSTINLSLCIAKEPRSSTVLNVCTSKILGTSTQYR